MANSNLVEQQDDKKVVMEAITKLTTVDPPRFLSPNPDLSSATRLASQRLFSTLKPYSPKSPFDQLCVDGFDAEQIWQQIDIQSQPLISCLKREVRKFERDPVRVSGGFGGEGGNGGVGLEEFMDEFEDEDESESEGEEEEGEEGGESESDDDDEEDGSESDEEDEDEDEEDDGDGVPEVEDDFLKIKELERFLEREERKEYGGEEEKKKKKKAKKKKKREVVDEEDDEEGDESESEEEVEGGIGELMMYGGGVDDEDEAAYNIMAKDFYMEAPKRKQKQREESDDSEMDDESKLPKRKQKHVDEKEDSEMEDANDVEDKEHLSTYEKEREKIQAKIKQMEEANLAEKEWTMQGEVTASKRPKDSALEVDLDFEHNARPPPVITEEVTASIEDIIKKRILEGNFDDVQRAPKLPSAAPKERRELDDNKSKKGLAEIYEEEYAQTTGLASAPLSHNDELKKESSDLFKRLCLKLDALSHFHFAPKPVVEDMSVQTNVPALAMEEIAPLAVSDAAMLAPEELFAGKGDIKEDTELTKEDRKKRRAQKKRKFKAINANRTASKVPEKTAESHSEGKEL